jgi:hypothetical protein
MEKTRGVGGNPSPRSAYDLRQRYEWLRQFTDDELREISLCNEDEPLQDGAQYFDISQPEQGQIIARGQGKVPAGSCYVWRGSVTEQTWRKLLNYGQSRQAGR